MLSQESVFSFQRYSILETWKHHISWGNEIYTEKKPPDETKQQVEEFICIESDKEEDGETWATVSLSSSPQTSSEESRLGKFLLKLKTQISNFKF